jgi:DNA-binding response OmpR family regulator
MNGLQLYDRMRSSARLASVPVLLLSAILPMHEVERRKIVSLGKPFDLDSLINTVVTLVSS